MTQIASLPTLSVVIGVDSTSWTTDTGQTLVDITEHVKDFRTTEGKQHELDRFETGQLVMTLDNRLGWFTPFDTTAQTYNVAGGGTYSTSPANLAATMNFLRVQATWSGTTYTVFRGFVSGWQLVTPDEVNSEIVVTAEDPMKMLSTTRLLNDTLYPNLLATQSATFIGTPTLILTRCGDKRAHLGPLATDAGGFAPSVLGNVNTQQAGPFVYDDTTAIDLSNGTQNPSGSISYPDMNPANNASTELYIEAWFKGAQTGDFLLSNYRPSNFQITGVGVDGDGHVRLQRRTLTATNGVYTDATLSAPHSGPDVTDGDWHHVGLQWTANSWTVFVDGQAQVTYADSTARLRTLSVGAWIGGSTTLPIGSYGTTATVANIAYAGLYTFSITDQTPYVHNRYRTGLLLQGNTYSAQATAVSGTGSVATITCGGFVTGQTVTLSGFSASALNGTFRITAHTDTTFSIASTVTSSTAGVVSLPYKTTGYRVLDTLQVAGVIPVTDSAGISAPALVKSSGTGRYWSIHPGTAFTGTEQGTAYNKSAAEVCLQASDTELGAFFWSHADRAFVFHDRFWWARNKDAGVIATLSDQPGTYARYLSDVEVIQDDLDLWTLTSVSTASGDSYTRTADTVTTYGPRTYTRTTDADSKITADAIADTILYRHKQPSLRVARVTLSSAAGSTNVVAMLNLNLGDAVGFERRDSATAAWSTTEVVEARQHEFRAEPGEWKTGFVLSPFEIYGSPYMTLDVTTIGSDGYFADPFGG